MSSKANDIVYNMVKGILSTEKDLAERGLIRKGRGAEIFRNAL
jgi:hypothetical protein